MTPNQIENWALQIVDCVNQKQPVEDCRVELKRIWPSDIYKTARQIAAHANASHGEPILWLLGIDEKEGVIGVDYEEISNRIETIKACFDGITPECVHINVVCEGNTIAAILWETERRPFVVKNAAYGKTAGVSASLEVPWREAGKTGSATRSDLIKILSPITKTPDIEVVNANLWIGKEVDDGYQIIKKKSLILDVYITPKDNAKVVIPFHRCKGKLSFPNTDLCINLTDIYIKQSNIGTHKVYGMDVSPTIFCSATEMIASGPGMISIESAPATFFKIEEIPGISIEVNLTLNPTGTETSILINAKLDYDLDEKITPNWSWKLANKQ